MEKFIRAALCMIGIHPAHMRKLYYMTGSKKVVCDNCGSVVWEKDDE